MACIEKSISLDGDIHVWIEASRGDVKRSTFINRIMRNEMNREQTKKPTKAGIR